MMRMIVRASSDDTFLVLLRKIKGLGLEVCLENKKRNFVAVKIPQSKSDILYELLGLGAVIERDVKHDLD